MSLNREHANDLVQLSSAHQPGDARDARSHDRCGSGRHSFRRTEDEARRLRQLIESEAWVEAVLALIELKLPGRKPVRITFDADELGSTLAQHPQVPNWPCETVVVRHAVLSLALLGAFIEARVVSLTAEFRAPRSVPRCGFSQCRNP
jgi:hypothetical protein